MEVYAEPLRVYCNGHSLRWLGDPSDLVSGFFADRLSRPEFLGRWRESQRPLRFWLIVGFKHFLFEESRRRKRDDRVISEADLEIAGSDRAYEQSCALGLLRRALSDTEEECRRAGLAAHWEVFEMFHLREMTLGQIAETKGIDPPRASVMKRTAAKRFAESLRQMVSWDGASESEIDAEVAGLTEGLSS